MWSKIAKIILNFIFPIACAGCRREGAHCCDQCFKKLPVLHVQQIAPGKIAAARFSEDSVLAELIHRFKYDGAKEIGALLTELFHGNIQLPAQKIFVPVPLHRRRQNMRGFNQSEVLALCLAKKFGGEVKNILRRHKYTEPQAQLDREHRLINVLAAFSMKNTGEKLSPGITYILVDDVLTTGSTLAECEKVLRQNGAQKIRLMAVAVAG